MCAPSEKKHIDAFTRRIKNVNTVSGPNIMDHIAGAMEFQKIRLSDGCTNVPLHMKRSHVLVMSTITFYLFFLILTAKKKYCIV